MASGYLLIRAGVAWVVGLGCVPHQIPAGSAECATSQRSWGGAMPRAAHGVASRGTWHWAGASPQPGRLPEDGAWPKTMPQVMYRRVGWRSSSSDVTAFAIQIIAFTELGLLPLFFYLHF